MSYTLIEQGLLAVIIANLEDFDSNNSKAGEEDEAFAYALANDLDRVCILDYAGFRKEPSGSFISTHVLWAIRVTFYIEYNPDTIETLIRSIVDRFTPLIAANHTFGGTTPGASLEAGDAFEAVRRGERTYIPVAFLIEAKEQIG